MTTVDATEEMIKELVEIEEVLCCLDQHAKHETASGAVYLTWYAKLIALRDELLADWNAEGSPAHNAVRKAIYRCDSATTPYHTIDNDGPCDVYTTNWHTHPGNVRLCDLHEQMALDEAEESKAARCEYLAAKRRGDDC